MRTTLSVSRWAFLLTMAVVMLFSVSEESYVPDIALPCCIKVSSRRIGRILKCFEQKPRHDCQRHAFLVVTRGDKQFCVDPAAQWFKAKLQRKELVCPPDYI